MHLDLLGSCSRQLEVIYDVIFAAVVHFFFMWTRFLLELDSLHRIQLSLTNSLCTWPGDKNECNTFVFSSFQVYSHIDPGILFAVVSIQIVRLNLLNLDHYLDLP